MNKLLSLGLLSLLSQNVWAANGSQLIGVGPGAVSQGGTGVSGTPSTIDAIHKNPALLNAQQFGNGKVNAEISTTVINQAPRANAGAGFNDTKSGVVAMPSVAAAYQINNQWTVGLGAFTYGGGIADFSNQNVALYDGIQTKHVLMKIQPAVSFAPVEGVRVGLAPFANYNTLVTNEALGQTGTSTRSANGQFALGLTGGVQIAIMKGLDFGLTYQTASTLYFQDIINLEFLTSGYAIAASQAGSSAAAAASVAATRAKPRNGIKITQPAELAAGLGYSISDVWRVAFDYRFIGWSGGQGYSDLGWKDQHVFALGSQYKLDKLKLRVGYNYGKSPIQSMTGRTGAAPTNFQNVNIMSQSLDLLNLVAFPALAEHHFTLGAGYAITDAFDADLGLMYSPKSSVTRSGTGLGGAYSYTTEVTQWSATVALAYRF